MMSGPYEGSYPQSLVNEVVPFIDKTYRTIPNKDNRAIARFIAGTTDCMHTNSKRLDKGAEFERKGGRNGHDLVDRYFDVFGHPAITIDTNQFQGVAHVGVTAQAGFAMTTGK